MKNRTLFLVANASKARVYILCKARFFKSPTTNELTLQEECAHPQSRMKGSELVADRLGGFGNGTFVETTPVKKQQAAVFAKGLAEKLNSARKEDENLDFIIAAPPTFLGLLREHIAGPLNNKIRAIQKDFTEHSEKELVTDLLKNNI